MTQSTHSPLAAPPRRVRLRPRTQNVRRAYRLIFALVIIVSGGWAVLDLFRWNELARDQQMLTVGFAVASVLCFVILRFVEHPYIRELHLGRIGYIAQGSVVSVNAQRRRHQRMILMYTFRTVAGDTLEARCPLPPRYPHAALEAGQAIEVLYDPARPQNNKPVLALEHVEFV